jgi:Arginase family
MDIQLLLIPYDSSQRAWRCGAGPEHLLRAGLPAHLQRQGHVVTAIHIVEDDPAYPPAEIRTAFELARRLATAVRSARTAGHFPLVLSGNCNTAVGTLSGLTPARRATFWFDAHGDCNTPETTTTGFLDGMGLAMTMGLCWDQLGATVPGFQPVAAEATFSAGRPGPRYARGRAFAGVGHHCHPSRADPGRAPGHTGEGTVGGYPRLSPLGPRCAGSGRRPRELPAGPQRPLPSPVNRRRGSNPSSGSARRCRAHVLLA